MSVTLNQLAYQIRQDISNGRPSKDTPYNIDYIILKIREALNEVLALEITRRRGNGRDDDRSIPSTYIATYLDQEILNETSTGRDYVTLPDFYINLKYDKGIHAIAPMKNPLKTMIRIPDPMVYSNLAAGELEGDNFGYYVEDQKAYFMKKIRDRVDSVIIKLVVAAPDKYSVDDVLPLSPENIIQVQERVKETMISRGIQDKINDQNKDIQVNVSN